MLTFDLLSEFASVRLFILDERNFGYQFGAPLRGEKFRHLRLSAFWLSEHQKRDWLRFQDFELCLL